MAGVVGDRGRMAGRALPLTLALSRGEREEESGACFRGEAWKRGAGVSLFPLGGSPGPDFDWKQ